MEKNLKYLEENGRDKLRDDLNSADEPIEFIKSLSETQSFKKNDLIPLFSMADLTSSSTQDIFSEFLRQKTNELKLKTETMEPEEQRRLINELKPFAEFPEFQDLMKTLLSKCSRIPEASSIPVNLHNELTPLEQARIYMQDKKTMYKWFDEIFEEAKSDFENDDFSYEKHFNSVAAIVFQRTKLVEETKEYCENEFMKSFHPVYSMTRFRIAIQDSPIAMLDRARPLACIIYNSFHGKKIDARVMSDACKHCGVKTSTVILGIPHMTIISKILYYGEQFGIEHYEFKKFCESLAKGTDATVMRISKNNISARIAGIALIQGEKVTDSVIRAIAASEPQEDLGKIMCRNFQPKYLPILFSWAQKNPWIYIDLLTTIKARDLDNPDLPTKPNLNAVQSAIATALTHA